MEEIQSIAFLRFVRLSRLGYICIEGHDGNLQLQTILSQFNLYTTGMTISVFVYGSWKTWGLF